MKQPTSLAAVMKAIFTRDDVPHKELVKLRKRVIQIHTAQRTATKPQDMVSQAMIAFTFLSYLENGHTSKQVRTMSMFQVLDRARELAKDLEADQS